MRAQFPFAQIVHTPFNLAWKHLGNGGGKARDQALENNGRTVPSRCAWRTIHE